MSSSGTSSSNSSSGASSVKKGYSNREKALFATCGVLSTLLVGSITLVSSSVFGSTFCPKPASTHAPGSLELQQGCPRCPAPVKKVCPPAKPLPPCSSYKPAKPPYPCLNYDDGEDTYMDMHCNMFEGMTSPHEKATGYIKLRQFINSKGDYFELEEVEINNMPKDPTGNGNISIHIYEFSNHVKSCDEMGNIYNPDDPHGWFRPGALGAFGPNFPVEWQANGTGKLHHSYQNGWIYYSHQVAPNNKANVRGAYTMLGRGLVIRSKHGLGMIPRDEKHRYPRYGGEGWRLGCCTIGRRGYRIR